MRPPVGWLRSFRTRRVAATVIASMIDGAHDPDAIAAIVDALCRAGRPASILTWKLSPRVQALLTGLACGDIPLTHQGLDDAGTERSVGTRQVHDRFEQ
jgi:hypothetical protein